MAPSPLRTFSGKIVSARAPKSAREARALPGSQFRLTPGRRRDDHDLFVRQGEHPVAIRSDADEFGAGAAAGELLHCRRFAWSHFFVAISRNGAGNGFFVGCRLRFLSALFFHFRRGCDFRFGSGRDFVGAFGGRRGFGAADFGRDWTGGGHFWGALRFFFANFRAPGFLRFRRGGFFFDNLWFVGRNLRRLGGRGGNAGGWLLIVGRDHRRFFRRGWRRLVFVNGIGCGGVVPRGCAETQT